jgi:hypothetical protein
MVSCTQKYSTSQYVPIQTMIYNVYLSIYCNIQGISGYILAWDIAKCLAILAWDIAKCLAKTPIPHTAKNNGHVLLQQNIYSYIIVCTLHICVYTHIYCDIYGHMLLQKVYTRIFSVLCISVYSYILWYIRTYATSTKYILVYTRMCFAYLYIYSYILWYTGIYYFNKVNTRIYSYMLCISVYILLYTVIYGHILLQQSKYLYILVCTLHICV